MKHYRIFIKRFGELLEKSESFIVESTLSGLSLHKWIEKGRKLNFIVKILFIYLPSPELCVQRIAARVSKGGHSVPEADIKRRFPRANHNFWHVYKELADEWSLFNNAVNNIFQVAGGDQIGEIILDEAKFEEWKDGKKVNSESTVSDEALHEMLKGQRIANRAVHKAQEENRKLGIPNWYSINGKIISDHELNKIDK